MPPATKQKSARSLKRSSPLHREPISSRGLFPRNLRSSKSTALSASTPDIEGDIKLVTSSPEYGMPAITGFVGTVRQASPPPPLNTPFVSTRGGETPPLLNDVEEIEMFATLLMKAVGRALAASSPPPTPACSHEPVVTSPPPPPLRASDHFRVSAPASPRLVLETPPTRAPSVPHVSRKSTRIHNMEARASIERETRLPLKTWNANTVPERDMMLRPLRGAGGSIFISRVGYKSAPAVPKVLV